MLAASRLPIEHPDFEALEACAPKRLFVKKKKTAEVTSQKHVKRDEPCVKPVTVSHSRSSSIKSALESDMDVQNTSHARESRERREKESKARLESREGLRAGAVVTDKDSPVRRALGPIRST